MDVWRGFGSDNHSGVHPEVIAAIAEANTGHAHAYGDDPWTLRATSALQIEFGERSQVAFVFNGTGANVVGLSAVCRPWESVICAESAHIATDECAAPEHIANVKLVTVMTPDGKLTPELVKPALTGFGFEHHAQPKVISVSNVSELGTVYTPDELRALANLAHEKGMLLHVDGARIANAAVALGASIADLTVKAGVDLVSLGGTKNGMLAGEAVVLLGDACTDTLPYVRKQSAQLASKMRFVSAQFLAMYGTDLWRRCATNANNMARALASGASARGIEIAFPVLANEVFALLKDDAIPDLQERFHFYAWEEGLAEGRSLVRWVTSWDTEMGEVNALLDALGELGSAT
ncbi:MAG: aminotransferase class I/II-fold pyridoxal phosphate-dependent enzyme [Coriobacteriia bacterium]|nr:aminotransferase class I/II-fold pyridoxal phosphate-dependent enzyme [Coriobacteriia bacterium]